MELKVNGATYQVDAEPETPLLWLIREDLGLSGTKFGCGLAQCGACTVLVDGVAVRSCVIPVEGVVGREIRTIESIESDVGIAPARSIARNEACSVRSDNPPTASTT